MKYSFPADNIKSLFNFITCLEFNNNIKSSYLFGLYINGIYKINLIYLSKPESNKLLSDSDLILLSGLHPNYHQYRHQLLTEHQVACFVPSIHALFRSPHLIRFLSLQIPIHHELALTYQH